MRARLESLFAAWGRLAYRRPWPIILGILAVSLALGTQLPRLELDTSTEGFLHEDDPIRIAYSEFREQFGRDDQVVLAIKAPDIFAPAFLERLRSLHDEIEESVPHLEDVQSLVNARYTRGENDSLVVGDLLEDWPETPAEFEAIRALALANPLYRDQIVTPTTDITTVMIRTSAYSSVGLEEDALAGFDDETTEEAPQRPFITGEETRETVDEVYDIVDRYHAPDFEIHASGTPILTVEMMEQMEKDMALFTGLALLVIALLLAALFRRAAGVLLPLVIVVLSVATTLATLALTGVPISLPTQILPSFLLAVGVGNSVHILAIFFQRQRAGADKATAIEEALGHSGLAVLMTSLTTAGGLISFSVAEIAPISHFGIFAPVGITIAFLYTIALLPSLIAVFPVRAPRSKEGEVADAGLFFSQRLLEQVGDFSTRHARAIVLASFGLMGVALLGALQLRFSHDPMAWFPEDYPARVANELINEEMSGAAFLEVVIDTKTENGLHEPATLEAMNEMRKYLARVQHRDIYVGKSVSLVDVVRESHQALNENRPEFYTIPGDRELIAQELLLFENGGSDDLEDLVDTRFSKTRMTLKLPFVDSVQYTAFLDLLDVELSAIAGEETEVHLTGLVAVFGGTILAMAESMARSYLIAMLVITPLMILLIGQVRLGLVAMIPNVAPILLTLGLMGWAGLPMDAFTLLIGSIALGLAVDDTIHFMHNFRRYYDASGDVRDAVRRTLTTTGQAMLITSLVLSAGFFIYIFATMQNLFSFGLLTGLTIILAFVSDVVLAPALMTLVARAPQEATSTGIIQGTPAGT